METSGNPKRLGVGRLAVSAAIWVAFFLLAHEAGHRFLPVTGPVFGDGLKVLGVQALVLTLAVLALMALRQPIHLFTPRAVLAIAIWLALLVLGHHLSHLDAGTVRATLVDLRAGMGMGALLACALMLAVLLGLPFVPSVEMGLMMMAVFGREGAVAAWLATVAGLSMAHAAGRYMPPDRVQHWLDRYGLGPEDGDSGKSRVTGLLARLHLSKDKARRIGVFLLGHRYLLFAALINMPGNSVLGGGGGIALVGGFARLYSWPGFLLTVALASLPIPLLAFLGLIAVDEWLAALGG